MTLEHRFVAAALALPIVALAGLTGYKALKLSIGTEVTVPIVGYDPRDLLSGHYLTYRLDIDHPAVCADAASDDSVFVCLEQGGGRTGARRTAGLDADATACAVVLRGRCEHARFVAGIERFYIPEEHASRLDRVVRNWTAQGQRTELLLAVDASGVASVKDLLIDGRSWRDFIRDPEPP